MRRKRYLFAWLVVSALSCGTPVLANDETDCSRTNLAPDTRIAACTRVVEAGKASKSPPANVVRALLSRGKAHNIKREYDLEIADYDEAIRLQPNHVLAHSNRCKAWNDKGDPERALRDCNKAIGLDPKDSYAHNNRGDANSKIGRLDDALKDFDEAIKLGLKHAVVFDNRGNVNRRKGNYDRAIEDFSEAIKLDPKDPLPWHNRAETYRVKGEFALALADNTEALRLDPGFTSAYTNSGLIHERTGNRERAQADYKKALSMPPDSYYLGSWAHGTARDRLAILGVPISDPKASAQPRPGADPGRRIALVVGNSAYKSVAALPNPRHDASTIADALRRAGFQTVVLHNDLGREKLIDALRGFSREAEKADWALVYFAGHGIEMNGTNYLIPIDAKLETDRDVQFEAVPLDNVISAIDGAKKLRLILLDACRDNPFASQMRRTNATRSVGRGLASIEPAAGMLVVYAAKHGEVALDGAGKNSPFVTAFIKNLEVPGLEIRRFFDYVRDDVMESTDRRQQPFSYGSVPGRQDFFFIAK